MTPLVFDHVLHDPDTYRAGALALPFGDIVAGPDVTFHGMAAIGASPLSALLDAHGLTTTFSAFRLSPAGQEEPNFIHTDMDMGDWTAILYLNPEPPAGDGTTFWKVKLTGDIASHDAAFEDRTTEWLAWRRLDLWESWQTVAARFNRLLLFPSALFHSRAIFENYGEGEDARLIQLCFGTGSLPCA